MRRLILALSYVLAATLLLGAIVVGVAYWLSSNPRPAEPVFDVSKLTYDDNIVGHWKSVSLKSDEYIDGTRVMAVSGEIATRYGDVIHRGTYKVIDESTIDTTYVYHGERPRTIRWTFGFMDRKLIMIHQTRGWVEAYERATVDELERSLLP
jgi:hypothetical protein